MTEVFNRRPVAIRTVLPFVFTHWMRQPWLCAGIAASMLGATMADIFMPLFAGRLVDAVTMGISDTARHAAFVAFGSMIALGLVHLLMRQCAFSGIIPFTLKVMSDISTEAFHRVQRFSTDWHANTFAGSTVRKVTRGMWALDLLDDTLLLALLPSFAVLSGSMILLGLHWPVLGLRDRGGRGDLRGDDRVLLDRLHRAGGAAVECVGHPRRRHAGRRLDLQSGGQIVRLGGSRGREAWPRHRQVAQARAADLDALHQHLDDPARGALVHARLDHRRRAVAVACRSSFAGRCDLCA